MRLVEPERLQPHIDQLNRWVRRYWRRALVALHIAKMIFWFRDVNPFTGFPITNVDYIQFYARSLRIHEFLERSGRIWGYDPFDMAGSIAGPFHEVGVHALALIAHALSPLLPIAVSLLVVEIAVLVALPFLVFPVMRLAGASRRTAWIAFGIVVLTFGVVEPFSVYMVKLGLWGFMTSAFVGLLQVALLYHWIQRPTGKAWTLLAAASAAVFQIHPAALVVVMIPNLALYVLNARRLAWRAHAALWAVAVIVIVTNWCWLSPFLAFSHWRVTAPYYETRGLIDIVSRFGPVQQDAYRSVQAMLNIAAVFLGGTAIRRLWHVNRPLAQTLAVWAAWLFVVSYFGSWIPWVRTLQPGRNEFAFFLLMYLLAATVFESHVLSLRRPQALVSAVVPFLVLVMFECGPGMSPWSRFAQPLGTDLMYWQNLLVQHLRANARTDGRVLLECADDLNPHFADIVPALTGAVLLGGQHPGNFLATRFSLFTGDWVKEGGDRSQEALAFGGSLKNMTEKEFSDYLDLYNVVEIIARTPSMIRELDRMKDVLEFIDELPPHHRYRVRKKSSWFAAGDGALSLDYDRVTIDNASTGIIIPKVHWFDTFKSNPPVPIRPMKLKDDPVPFLWIDNSSGHKTIEVFNGGLPSFGDRLRNGFKKERSW